MKITFLGHSGFVFDCCSEKIAIDPFISGNPITKAKLDDIEVQDVLITHAHGDHIGDAIEIAKRNNAKITAVFELANYCTSQGVDSIGANLGGRVKYPWGEAVLVPATHTTSLPDGSYAGVACGYVINMCGNLIYHAGDTGLHYDMKMIKEVYRPETAILPIGDFYTMGIDDAVMAAHWLGVKTVIPMHYNTFTPIKADPYLFAKKLKDKIGVDCLVIQPGEFTEISSSCPVN